MSQREPSRQPWRSPCFVMTLLKALRGDRECRACHNMYYTHSNIPSCVVKRVYVEHNAATRRFAVVTAVAGKGLMCTATVRTWLALGR